MTKEYKGKTTSNYGLNSLMVNAYKFHIVCLNTESHNERIMFQSIVGHNLINLIEAILLDFSPFKFHFTGRYIN